MKSAPPGGRAPIRRVVMPIAYFVAQRAQKVIRFNEPCFDTKEKSTNSKPINAEKCHIAILLCEITPRGHYKIKEGVLDI